MSFNLTNVNPNSYYTVDWYPKGRRKQSNGQIEHEEIRIEVLGAINENVSQPIRNGRVSVNGTSIKTYNNKEYKVGQEIRFIDRWWSIMDIQYDLNEIAPQSQMYSKNNMAIYLTISSSD